MNIRGNPFFPKITAENCFFKELKNKLTLIIILISYHLIVLKFEESLSLSLCFSLLSLLTYFSDITFQKPRMKVSKTALFSYHFFLHSQSVLTYKLLKLGKPNN